MTRRHLTLLEAQAALRRGRSVEVFLGKCRKLGAEGIRYIVVSRKDDQIVARMYDCAIPHGSEGCDIYSFGSIDEDLEDGQPDNEIAFSNFDECIIPS